MRTKALLPLAVVALFGCGALDDSAPARPQANACKTVDEQMQPLVALGNSGKLRHIAAIVSHDLDEPTQRAIVRLVLNIAKAMPADSMKKIPDLLKDPSTTSLIPIVVAILRPLPGDAKAQPPIPAKIVEMTAFSGVARTCLRQDLYALMTDLLRDPRMPTVVDQINHDISGSAGQMQNLLKQAGVEGRSGLLALLHNALASIAAPGFDPKVLLDALAGLRNPAKPTLIDTAYTVLQAASYLPNGEFSQPRAAALQHFAACFLQQDPDVRVLGEWYDVLLSADVSPSALPATPLPGSTAQVVQLLAVVTQVLADDEASRDALNQTLGLMLRPDLAVGAIPELIELLESDTLKGVIGLLADLVLQPCRASEAP